MPNGLRKNRIKQRLATGHVATVVTGIIQLNHREPGRKAPAPLQMPIPVFDRHGLLPPGVHDCSLAEIAEKLGTGSHRQRLVHLFHEFIVTEIRPDFDEPLYVDGSFVTGTELPNDVDVVLDLRHATESKQVKGLRFMKEQPRFSKHYDVHFWVNILHNNDFTAFFQYVGPKVVHKGLKATDMKGILRIVDD